MPTYNIEPTEGGLHIHVADVAGSERALLGALQECQEGRCSCPTPEYQKLAEMRVRAAGGTVEVDLQTKPGATLKTDAVQTCLDFTIARLDKSG